MAAEQGDALLAEPLGFIEVALSHCHEAEAAEAPSDPQGIVQCSADGKALFSSAWVDG